MNTPTNDETLGHQRAALAGLAMLALIKLKGIEARPDEVAKEAVAAADALLKALNPAASP